MENSLNILHYCIYKLHYKLHLLFSKINPFRLIHKLPFQKRRYEQLGIDIDQQINQAFGDKEYGVSIMVAGGGIVGILFFLFMGIAIFIIKMANIDLILNTNYFLVFVGMSTVVSYYFVFKGDKYMKHFKKYENWTKKEKRKYALCSFAFIISILFLFLLPLM